LPSGSVPGNPAELLESDSIETVIADLRRESDFVVIDGAPVLGLSDALALCRLADAVILVADAGRTRRTTVRRAWEQLGQVNGRLIGSVLNNVDARAEYAYDDR
jgi:Mrp family chromosome partitioning ATPase